MMKYRFLAISALLAAAFAQTAFTQATAAPDPAARHTQMLTKMLGLTSDQQTKVQMILANETTTVQANQAAVKTARTNLIAAIKSSDPNLSTYVQQAAQARQADDVARANAAAAIYAVLTPDQRTKVDNGVEMLAGLGGGRGPGGPGAGPMMHRGGGPR